MFPGLPALLPAISTGLALRGAEANGLMVRVLSLEPLQKIGRLSYSWYLWHWPVIVFGAAIITAPSLALRVGLALASLAIAAASFRWVEDPIRHNRGLAKRPMYAFAMAAAIAVVGISVSLAWRQACIWAAAAVPRLVSPKPIRWTGVNQRLFGELLGLDGERLQFWNPRFPGVCSPSGRQSRGAMVFRAGADFGIAGLALMPMVKSACAMVDAPFFYGLLGRTYTECGEWRKNALERIRQIRPLLTVVASADGYSFDDAEWKDGISRVVNELASSSQNVLILKDTPSADLMCRPVWLDNFGGQRSSLRRRVNSERPMDRKFTTFKNWLLVHTQTYRCWTYLRSFVRAASAEPNATT